MLAKAADPKVAIGALLYGLGSALNNTGKADTSYFNELGSAGTSDDIVAAELHRGEARISGNLAGNVPNIFANASSALGSTLSYYTGLDLGPDYRNSDWTPQGRAAAEAQSKASERRAGVELQLTRMRSQNIGGAGVQSQYSVGKATGNEPVYRAMTDLRTSINQLTAVIKAAGGSW